MRCPFCGEEVEELIGHLRSGRCRGPRGGGGTVTSSHSSSDLAELAGLPLRIRELARRGERALWSQVLDALVFALKGNVKSPTHAAVVVQDFVAGLNRRGLVSSAVAEELSKYYAELASSA